MLLFLDCKGEQEMTQKSKNLMNELIADRIREYYSEDPNEVRSLSEVISDNLPTDEFVAGLLAAAEEIEAL
jgi:uncharacterized protein YegL